MNLAQLSPRIVTGWRQLEQESVDDTPRFKCGHPKTPANSVDIGRRVICLDCKRFAARAWYDKHLRRAA